MAELILSRLADQDLGDIYIYSFQQFGAQQAECYTRDIHNRFDLLADFPRMGLPARVGEISCLKFPTGSHVIYYKRTERGIFIARILHATQDPDRQIFEK